MFPRHVCLVAAILIAVGLGANVRGGNDHTPTPVQTAKPSDSLVSFPGVSQTERAANADALNELPSLFEESEEAATGAVPDTGCQCPTYLNGDGRMVPYLPPEGSFGATLALSQRLAAAGGGNASLLRESICGDVNGDGLVNITDAVSIVRYLFGAGPPPLIVEDADINLDGKLSITDAVQLIGFIFNGFPGPCSPAQPGTVYVVAALDTEPMLLTDAPYAQHLVLNNYSRPGPSVLTGIMNPIYRSRFLDSRGGQIKFTFYLMSSESICQSDKGCNAIFTAMKPFAPEVAAYGDELAWHYHNTAWRGYLPGSPDSSWSQIITFNGTNYGLSQDVEAAEKMLSRLLIDDDFFPTDYRAGWVWENTDFSNWLEGIMPFDFSNLAPRGYQQPPNANIFWNYYDWTRAPRGWQSYHPSSLDYQVRGDQQRSMFYCSCCGFNAGDFDEVFRRAANGDNAYLCLYGHTYTDLDDFFSSSWYAALMQRSQQFNVPFEFATAREAACAVLGLYPLNSAPQISLQQNDTTIQIKVDRDIFQWLPYCALKQNGNYRRVYPVRVSNRIWTFDTSGLGNFEFAVGVCDRSGKAGTARLVR